MARHYVWGLMPICWILFSQAVTAMPDNSTQATNNGTATPDISQQTTNNGSTTPETTTQVTNNGSTTPATSTQTTIIGSTTPATSTQTTIIGSTTPATSTQTTIIGSTTPATSTQAPKNGSTTPEVIFYTFPLGNSSGTPLTEDLEGLISSQPITLVTHGFRGDITSKSMQAIIQAFIHIKVQNLVLVDWGQLSHPTNMTNMAAYNNVRDYGVPTAANVVARWLQRVMTLKNISPDQVHLVGFSLGAHMAGVVGRLLNSTIGRITALDPPRFGYELVPVHKRLDSSAAKFVNVIHTSGTVLGYPVPIGHVDFFPNGDAIPQPGCPTETPKHIITCSHYRSFMLFAESVLNENSFLASECESWLAFVLNLCNNKSKAPMGYATSNLMRGTFYMKTNSKTPYGTEDSAHPIPEDMKPLLTYDETEKDLLDPYAFLSSGSHPQVLSLMVIIVTVFSLRHTLITH